MKFTRLRKAVAVAEKAREDAWTEAVALHDEADIIEKQAEDAYDMAVEVLHEAEVAAVSSTEPNQEEP